MRFALVLISFSRQIGWQATIRERLGTAPIPEYCQPLLRGETAMREDLPRERSTEAYHHQAAANKKKRRRRLLSQTQGATDYRLGKWLPVKVRKWVAAQCEEEEEEEDEMQSESGIRGKRQKYSH
jgi:hypothetical protein